MEGNACIIQINMQKGKRGQRKETLQLFICKNLLFEVSPLLFPFLSVQAQPKELLCHPHRRRPHPH